MRGPTRRSTVHVLMRRGISLSLSAAKIDVDAGRCTHSLALGAGARARVREACIRRGRIGGSMSAERRGALGTSRCRFRRPAAVHRRAWWRRLRSCFGMGKVGPVLRGGDRGEMARWRDGVRGMGEHCLGESPIVSCAGGAQVALTPREGAQHHSWRRPSSGGEEVPVRNDGSDRTNT